MNKIHLCLALGCALFVTGRHVAAQTNEDAVPAATATTEAAPGLSVGSGVEYHFSSIQHQLDMTFAVINVGKEGDGYWLENRTSFNFKSTSTRFVAKTLLVGNPPRPTRMIIQSANLKPKEVSPQKLGSSAGLHFLQALAGGLELFQTEVTNRQIQQAATAHVHTNAEILQYAGKQSTEIQLPAQPISPANSGADAGVNWTEDSAHLTVSSGPTDSSQSANPIAKAVNVGTETITVPAGTFECDHYTRDSNGRHSDIWLSARVPTLNPGQASSDLPRFGIVKVTSADITMELTRLLDNQVSEITETAKRK